MLRTAVVIGGLGQMGSLVSCSLRTSGMAVTLVDIRPMNAADGQSCGDLLQCDVSAMGGKLRSAIAAADCVWVCLPEKIALQVAKSLAGAMPDGCLWVDTLSVKTDMVAQIEEERGRLEALSINPMFAPRMGWNGNSVAVVDVLAGPRSALLRDLMNGWGCRLETVTADEHDRLTAGIQVATHAAVLAFGAALLNMRIDLTQTLRLATPPHRLLLTLLHRMTTQSSDVYWDIQAYHPLGTDVCREMIGALETLTEDSGRFKEMLAQLTALFANHDEPFKRWAKRAFELNDR